VSAPRPAASPSSRSCAQSHRRPFRADGQGPVLRAQPEQASLPPRPSLPSHPRLSARQLVLERLGVCASTLEESRAAGLDVSCHEVTLEEYYRRANYDVFLEVARKKWEAAGGAPAAASSPAPPRPAPKRLPEEEAQPEPKRRKPAAASPGKPLPKASGSKPKPPRDEQPAPRAAGKAPKADYKSPKAAAPSVKASKSAGLPINARIE
jgi:hypothetical protein